MEPLHRGLPAIDFPVCEGVEKLSYCSHTGEIANTYCPIGGEGYYKTSSKRGACNQHFEPMSTGDNSNSENNSEEKQESSRAEDKNIQTDN